MVNTDNLPCSNSNAQQTNGCLNYETNGIADEYFLRSPSTLTIINYILFIWSLSSFALNPHMLQRAFTAQHDWQLRFVVMCLFTAPFICMIPGLLTGITHISNNWIGSAFFALLAELRDQGGFVAFISYVAMLAGIAGLLFCVSIYLHFVIDLLYI